MGSVSTHFEKGLATSNTHACCQLFFLASSPNENDSHSHRAENTGKTLACQIYFKNK